MGTQFDYLIIELFDNTEGRDTCCSCKTFKGSWIYCPIFMHIMEDGEIDFDETGENNRCELFSNT